MRNLLLAAAGFLAVAAAHTGAQANLVQDGSFAQPNVGGGWSSFSNGNVPGWTNTSNSDGIEVDSHGPIGMTQYNASTPQSAELDGATFDTISQTITGLSIGETYALSWAYGDRPGSGPQLTDVYFGGALVGSDTGSGSGTWTNNSVDVTATATSEVLSFAAVNTSAQGGSPSVGNEITAVSLTAADVPEPATMAVLGAGLSGLVAARRRKAV